MFAYLAFKNIFGESNAMIHYGTAKPAASKRLKLQHVVYTNTTN